MKKNGNLLLGPITTGLCGGALIAKLLMWLIPALAAYRMVCVIVCVLLTLGIGAFFLLRWWKTLPEDELLPRWAANAWIGSTWGTTVFFIVQLMDTIAELPEPWTTLAIAAPLLGFFAGLLYSWCKTAFIAHSGR